MNKILDISDIEMLARVAKRRALNFKIHQEQENDKRLEFDQFIANSLDEAGIGKEILSDPISREVIQNGLKTKFKYKQSKANENKIKQLKREANEVLSDELKAEIWKSDDCGCVLQRIYHPDNPFDSHTFDAVKCESHKDLNMVDLHHTINEETLRRSEIQRHLHNNYEGIISERKEDNSLKNKDEVITEFKWEGQGKERILKVKLSGVDDNIKNEINSSISELSPKIEKNSELSLEQIAINNIKKQFVIIE